MKAATRLKQIKRVEKLEQNVNTHNIHVELKDDYTLIINPEAKDITDTLIYKPSATFKKLHADDSMVRCIMGCYGSGKTTGCLIEAVIQAIKMPCCLDGVRRAKIAIIRNTYPELYSTTVPSWDNWFANLGRVKKIRAPFLENKHWFRDKDGEIFLHVLFIALARPEDIRKLKSFEPSHVILEEVIELDKATFDHAKIRTGRWPSEQLLGQNVSFDRKIICATNPPPESHWFYQLFEIDKPPKHVLYKQPAALLWQNGKLVKNPEAENIEHLNNGYNYYFDAAFGQTKEFIKVYIMGKYGVLQAGKVVYPDYNDDLHSVDDIKIDRNEPIIATVDYGTIAPAILLAQYVNSQLRVIKEFCGDFVTVKELWQFFAYPWLKLHATGLSIDIYGDPANTYNGAEQLQECGLIVSAAPSNKIDKRISAVVDLLTVFVQRHPRLLISQKGCPQLRNGFLKHYHFKELKTIGGAAYKDVPEKNHPFSDVHDCLQYQALLVGGGFSEHSDDDPYEEIRRYRLNELKNDVTGY